MSNNINPQLFKKFIIDKIGMSLDKNEAKKLGVKNEFDAAIAEVDVDDLDIEIDDIDLNDILKDKNSDLYKNFAVKYETELEKKQEAKDKEKEKEEETRVKDKNDAKA